MLNIFLQVMLLVFFPLLLELHPIKQSYKTSDIYIAALLRTAGLKFLGVTKNGVRGVFEFEDSPDREKLILDFFNGEVVQNIRQYIDNWMHFKKLVERL